MQTYSFSAFQSDEYTRTNMRIQTHTYLKTHMIKCTIFTTTYIVEFCKKPKTTNKEKKMRGIDENKFREKLTRALWSADIFAHLRFSRGAVEDVRVVADLRASLAQHFASLDSGRSTIKLTLKITFELRTVTFLHDWSNPSAIKWWDVECKEWCHFRTWCFPILISTAVTTRSQSTTLR